MIAVHVNSSPMIAVRLNGSPMITVHLNSTLMIGSLVVGVRGLSVVHPGTDLIEVEAPYAPDLEAGKIAGLQKAVNRDAVYVEVCG